MIKFVMQITNWEETSLNLLYFDSLREANVTAMKTWLKLPLEDKNNITITTGVILPDMCLLNYKGEDEKWYETFYTTYDATPKCLQLGRHKR